MKDRYSVLVKQYTEGRKTKCAFFLIPPPVPMERERKGWDPYVPLYFKANKAGTLPSSLALYAVLSFKHLLPS